MLPAQDASNPEWIAALVPWLLAVIALATGAGAVALWTLLHRLRGMEKLGDRLGPLEEIKATVQQFARDRGDLDLRRIEHVLIELRDGQRRLEDAVLRAAQSRIRAQDPAASAGDPGVGLSERIVQRLLAHGYEQVHVVPNLEELAELFRAEGAHEVLVEARRNGVLCKGRALVRDGVLTDVELKPAYTMFP